MTDPVAAVADRWFQPETAPDAETRVFLFHYAGSGASIYRDWPPLIPADISTQCIQLPGRQERLNESMFTDVVPLVETIADRISAELDGRPYAVFGHCMGALIGYRLTVELAERGEQAPVLLGASAWAPKGFRTPPPEQLQVPQEKVVEWARGLGSLPDAVVNDPEAISLMMPAMRADLEVCASYADDGAAVPCPIVTYSADHDPLVDPEAMASWVPRTENYLGNRLFRGMGHFFIHEETTSITADFVRLLRGRVASR
ncbi:thioesterase II family protein [Actinacidiphila guanduensis]|uniref:Surfactin synthase thioesterase subunit n=1 Tax=Actinacidiphila guanduensis TaxID=310781 RepID=A0A1H0J138_9ACTN|nr:alpha/beta fold hydrolase [Actinacidiphila guanduensis]SDO37263.1 Surfactin synthase thioesterase subunit [Actinacidiphila guanduensis]